MIPNRRKAPLITPTPEAKREKMKVEDDASPAEGSCGGTCEIDDTSTAAVPKATLGFKCTSCNAPKPARASQCKNPVCEKFTIGTRSKINPKMYTHIMRKNHICVQPCFYFNELNLLTYLPVSRETTFPNSNSAPVSIKLRFGAVNCSGRLIFKKSRLRSSKFLRCSCIIRRSALFLRIRRSFFGSLATNSVAHSALVQTTLFVAILPAAIFRRCLYNILQIRPSFLGSLAEYCS